MRKHRFDPISLVFGLVFVTAASIVLGGGSLVDDGRFLVPATLLGLGVALLAHTASRSRSTPDPAAPAPADPGSYWSTPDHTDYTWSWDRTRTPDPTPTGTAAASDRYDSDDEADAEDGAAAPEPDAPGSSATRSNPPAAPAADAAPARSGLGDPEIAESLATGLDGTDDPAADADLANLPEADAPSPADLAGPDLPSGSDALVPDDRPDASGGSSPGWTPESAQDSDVTAAEVTIEEPDEEPEAADPDAGLHDPTVEEPTVEELGPPNHDAWVWQRVESSEDGRPTWVRRPDTDDHQDEDPSPG